MEFVKNLLGILACALIVVCLLIPYFCLFCLTDIRDIVKKMSNMILIFDKTSHQLKYMTDVLVQFKDVLASFESNNHDKIESNNRGIENRINNYEDDLK